MADPMPKMFIVDCPTCRAKVAAIEHGCVKINGGVYEGDASYGVQVFLGKCPKCDTILVGESQQIAIDGYDSDHNEWAEAIRVYPQPPKTFTSRRIPRTVSESLADAVKSLQASANLAACVMFGCTLEAICRDLLEPRQPRGATKSPPPPKRVMLGAGIRKLKDKGLIDERLFDWSQQLQAFRNLAAHPTGASISREDADDLCSFVYAIIEYVYDLTDRYNEFKTRLEEKKAEKKAE